MGEQHFISLMYMLLLQTHSATSWEVNGASIENELINLEVGFTEKMMTSLIYHPLSCIFSVTCVAGLHCQLPWELCMSLCAYKMMKWSKIRTSGSQWNNNEKEKTPTKTPNMN